MVAHASGFAAGRRRGAAPPDIAPAQPDRAICRLRHNVAGWIWRRAGLCPPRHRRKVQMDDGGRVQRNLRAVPFPAGPQHRQSVDGVRVALPRNSRRHRGLCRAARPSRRSRDDSRRALCPFRRNRGAAAHPRGRVQRGGRPADSDSLQDDDAAGQKARSCRACAAGRGVRRDRAVPVAAADRAAGGDPDQHRNLYRLAPKACRMNEGGNPIWTLAWTFGLMSLFAVGGANAAIPEVHRVAVEVHHWLTDKQFADVYAISQLSPGPNVLIVTLIGYSVAGVAGGLVATLAMCVPTAVLAYYVSRLLARSSQSRWPAILQAALVPLSIGLMTASGLVVALAADRTWVAALVTVAAAGLAFATRVNPLWLLLAGGVLGFVGVIG